MLFFANYLFIKIEINFSSLGYVSFIGSIFILHQFALFLFLTKL